MLGRENEKLIMNRYDLLLNKNKKPIIPDTVKKDAQWFKNYRIYEWGGRKVCEEKFPRANIEHECKRCHLTIRKGHFYKIVTLGLKRGYSSKSMIFESFKLCLRCADVLQSGGKLL